MANHVKTPMQNYFEKVLDENLTFEIPPMWFLVEGLKKIVTSPPVVQKWNCHHRHRLIESQDMPET